MKIDFLREKSYDLIFISPDELAYFSLEKNKVSFKISKAEAISGSLLEQGLLKFENLEKSLSFLIRKHKLKELGIVLHLPNILFQKISLPRGRNPQETISNYLKTSFPLPLEKYTFFYKEDKYKLTPTLSNFNIFFIEKNRIDVLLSIIEKYNILPLFITPSLEVVYQYLLGKSLIDFHEEYLVFFIDRNLLFALLIKNLRIEKVITEEISLNAIDFNLLIFRLYNFLKTSISPNAKVLIFSEKKQKISEISHQQIFFDLNPKEILIEGSYLIFNRVFSGQDFIDFLPLKPYSVYFFNRLLSMSIFLSVYVFLLTLSFSVIYLGLDFKLRGEIKKLSNFQKIQLTTNLNREQIEKFKNLNQKLNLPVLENFDKIKTISQLKELESMNYSPNQALSFSLRVKKEDLEKVKLNFTQNFPNIRLVQEEIVSEDEVKLTYSF